MSAEQLRREMDSLRAELAAVRASERSHRATVDDLQLLAQEQREIAEQFDLERARLAAAQSVAKVGSWELDLRTNVLSWSDENYRIFEVDKREFGASYESFLERVHPDDRVLVNRAYIDSLANRVPYALDHRTQMSNGRVKIVHERCETFYDDTGTPLRSIGTSQDVTESRLAEVALHDSRQALRAVLDSVPQRVFWKDRDSVYLGCNRPFAQDMGFQDPNDVIGKTDFDATWKASADLYRSDDRAVVLSGQSKLNYEEPMLSEDGRQGWLRTSKVPLRGRDGNVTGIIGTYEDITEAKRLERQLTHAQRLESVGTLAAGMAHEINNPLAYVIGNVEVAREWLRAEVERLRNPTGDATEPEVVADVLQRLTAIEELLRDALDGAHRVRRLVVDIKGMARLEDGSRTPLDLRSIIESAVRMTANSVRHFAIVRTRFGATPLVEAGDGPLIQVITNLLLNAAQAIGEGHADTNEITISTYSDSAGWACVEMSDTGPGIPADVLPRVFDPFFTTKRTGAGMGLGLSTSLSIVAALGGRLTAESPPGSGAVFRLRLPPAPGVVVPRPPSNRPAKATRRGRILVIDDEPMVAVAVGRMLRAHHDVMAMTDAREALALLTAGEVYDLIFCDLMMPNLSGIEVYELVKATSSPMASKIVFMTGGAFTATAQDFLRQHGNTHVTKPFTAETIRSVAARFVT